MIPRRYTFEFWMFTVVIVLIVIIGYCLIGAL